MARGEIRFQRGQIVIRSFDIQSTFGIRHFSLSTAG
jgi:hypothetical protein